MAKGEVDDTEQLLDSLGELLTTLLEGPSGDADDGHSLIDEHLRSFFHAYYELRTRHQQQTLSVAVLALTKSGEPPFGSGTQRRVVRPWTGSWFHSIRPLAGCNGLLLLRLSVFVIHYHRLHIYMPSCLRGLSSKLLDSQLQLLTRDISRPCPLASSAFGLSGCLCQ